MYIFPSKEVMRRNWSGAHSLWIMLCSVSIGVFVGCQNKTHLYLLRAPSQLRPCAVRQVYRCG